MNRKQNLKTLASLFIAAPVVGLSLIGSPELASAQTTPAAATATDEAAKSQLTAAQQKQLASELFGLTKTATTSQQLNAMIAKCDKATAAGLSEKYAAYVRSLKAWALHRRGGNRYETAVQLKAVGNVAQYKIAIKSALSDFDDSIAIDTGRHRVFNARGIAYVLNEHYLKAASDFTKAVGLRADFTQGYFNRAEALTALGKYKLAIKDYSTVLRLKPEDAQAITGRAHANVELEQFEAAMADYNAVIKAHPTNAVALINRGDCYSAAASWSEALADYASAKKLSNSNGVTGSSTSNKVTDLADQRTAWLLATASDSSFRDANKALALITPCVARSSSPSVAMLETLAAAQAAAGRFEEAKQSQAQVIQLTGAEVSVDPKQTTDSPHKIRMALYQEEKPYVQRQQ